MICPASSVAATPVPSVSNQTCAAGARRRNPAAAQPGPRMRNASVVANRRSPSTPPVTLSTLMAQAATPATTRSKATTRRATRARVRTALDGTLTSQLRSSPEVSPDRDPNTLGIGSARPESSRARAGPPAVSGSLFLQGEADVRSVTTPVGGPRRARAAAHRRGRIGLGDHRDPTGGRERAGLLFHLHALDP